MKKNILIYNDEGVSAPSVAALTGYFSKTDTVDHVTGTDLRKDTTLRNVQLLIVPGGRSLPFYAKLQSTGNKNIVEFVKQGGCYVGLCAGAYYAATETVFAEGWPLALRLPGELNFFQGRAIGPVFADEDFAYTSERGARIVDVIDETRAIHPVYFNGGCYFDNAETMENTSVYARYALNHKPAIIVCRYGQGRAVLSGVHPELSYQSIPDDNDSHHVALREALLSSDHSRQRLFHQFISLCISQPTLEPPSC